MSDKTKDYFWLNLKALPYFRALLRAVEARAYESISLESPILDLGCGDGHFVTTAFDNKIDVGIDPWKGPIKEAATHQGYENLICGDGYELPFADNSFNSCISNSVLEHIDDVDRVVNEISRTLKQNSLFVFCVPNHNFLGNLSISNFFEKIGLKKLANSYRKFFNTISRHKHCDPPEVWIQRLNAAGFNVEKWWHYFSPQALHALEWGHYFGLPSYISKKMFNKWILVPYKWNQFITIRSLKKYYEEKPQNDAGSYSFYIAKKR